MIVVGDIHGEIYMFAGVLERLNIKRTNIYQVGDWGLGFMDEERDLANLKIVNEIMIDRDCHLYIIRGNHDNPEFWRRDDIELSNVTLVDDYNVVHNDDGTTLFIGGGISIDRCFRVKGSSYWENEKVVFDEAKLKIRLDEVNHYGLAIDRVITHVAPRIAPPLDKLKNNMVEGFIVREKLTELWKNHDLRAELEAERGILSKVWETLKDAGNVPKEWFYGHYHKNMEHTHEGTKFICCGILELYNGNKEVFM